MEQKRGTDFTNMSTEEILDLFSKISRQRISQIISKYSNENNFEILDKLINANNLLKKKKHAEKNGYSQVADRVKWEKAKMLWHSMHGRCNRVESYKNCSVAFKSFNEFFEWALSQKGFCVPGFELDKDILVKKNQIYSKETCCFVPQKLNSLLVGCNKNTKKHRGNQPLGVVYNKGSNSYVAQINLDGGLTYLGSFSSPEKAFQVYKEVKEQRIKILAEEYKEFLEQRVYDALLQYKVEIDD